MNENTRVVSALFYMIKMQFTVGLIVCFAVFATACKSNNGKQLHQAEQAVGQFVQRRTEMRGAIYAPISFKTRAYSNAGEYRYQVFHTYTITVEKGETMKENGEFIVDSTGSVHEFGQP